MQEPQEMAPVQEEVVALDRKKLPEALRRMVDFTEAADWAEVRAEVLRQWPDKFHPPLGESLPGPEEDSLEARHRLVALILGTALGVTAPPHPEAAEFPALRQAMKLASMTQGERARLLRESKAKALARAAKRKERKAKRRERKRHQR